MAILQSAVFNENAILKSLVVLAGALALILAISSIANRARLPKGARLPPGPEGKFTQSTDRSGLLLGCQCPLESMSGL